MKNKFIKKLKETFTIENYNRYVTFKFIKWCYSTNHKIIGSLYIVFAMFGGVIGTTFSVLMRIELSAPGNQFFWW